MTDPATIVRDYYRYFDQRLDAIDVFSIFASEAVYYRPTGTLHGAAEIREYFRAGPRPDLVRHDVVRVVVQGPTVVAEGRVSTTVGHERREIPFADVWDLDAAGKVTRRASYFDTGLLR